MAGENKPQDVARGTTGNLQHGNWLHGYPTNTRRIRPDSLNKHALSFANNRIDEPETIRYSSVRVLERRRNADAKQGAKPTYGAADIRNMLRNRNVKEKELHWAGLGEDFAPEGKHPIEHWINHVSSSLPRFYSSENDDNAEDFARQGFSAAKHFGNMFYTAHMTHVNSYLPSNHGPIRVVGDDNVNRGLAGRGFYHQERTEASETGHHRGFGMEHIGLRNGLLRHENKQAISRINDSYLPSDFDPTKISHMPANRLLARALELGALGPFHDVKGSRNASEYIQDALTHLNTRDEMEQFYSPELEKAFNERLREFGSIRRDNVYRHAEMSDHRDIALEDIFSRARDEARALHDRYDAIRDVVPEDYGKHEHIEEVQSDYAQHPQWFRPPSDYDREKEKERMERWKSHARQNEDHYGALMDAMREMHFISAGDRPHHDWSSVTRPIHDLPNWTDQKGDIDPASHFPKYGHGIVDGIAHNLQKVLANMYYRGGLDLTSVKPDIEAHVNDIADRLPEEFDIKPTEKTSERTLANLDDRRSNIKHAQSALRDLISGNTDNLDRNWHIGLHPLEWIPQDVANRDFVRTGPQPDHLLPQTRLITRPEGTLMGFGYPTSQNYFPSEAPLDANWRSANGTGTHRDAEGIPTSESGLRFRPTHETLEDIKFLPQFVFGQDEHPYAVNVANVRLPRVHWTRGVINHLNAIGERYHQAFRVNDTDGANAARQDMRDALFRLTSPYRTKGLENVDTDMPNVNDFSDDLSSPYHQAQRTGNITSLADTLTNLFEYTPDWNSKDELEARKQYDNVSSLPVDRVIPVEQRGSWQATDPVNTIQNEREPIERPLPEWQTAIPFMVRHAIAHAIARGADSISIAPTGFKNGEYRPGKENSFWDRLGRTSNNEFVRFGAEHKGEVGQLPWLNGTTASFIRVTPEMRESVKRHGIHAFDNGFPSTIDRVTKSVASAKRNIIVLRQSSYVSTTFAR